MSAVAISRLVLLPICVLYAQQYFPAGALARSHEEDKSVSASYSKCLKALQEPSLWELSQRDSNMEAYRFLWLRTFHHPISVRLVVTESGKGLLIVKETGGKGGYEIGTLIKNRSTRLSKQTTEGFTDRIEELRVWDAPTHLRSEDDVIGLDGAEWIIEAVKEGRYHIIDRWSPDRPAPVRILGEILTMDLAGFRLLYQEVY